MKELKDYTEFELRSELNRRIFEEQEEESKILPDEFLPYKEVTNFKHTDHCKYFHVHVDEGSEGIDYLVQYNYRVDDYDHSSEEDELLNDTMKHLYISAAEKGGWDAAHEGIDIGEIGHYGVTLFTIDATERKEDDE
jgi:hypothetical protein